MSRDVAKFVHERYKSSRLKVKISSSASSAALFCVIYVLFQMFKLEDVAMGIWVAEMEKEGAEVKYVDEERIFVDGCEEGYVVAHYQGPRDMLCLWQSLKETNRSTCCSKR